MMTISAQGDNMYTKINRNSLGQWLKTRIKYFWHSNNIVPSHKVQDPKTKVVVTVPASVSRGTTYVKDK